MTTLHHYDLWGWYSPAEIPGRSTDVDPGSVPSARVVGQPWPNWIGTEWAMHDYVEPPAIEPPAPPAVPRKITLGAFQKRLVPMRVHAIDTSTHSKCVALRSYLSRLTHVDLEDPDLPLMLGMLVAAEQPAANPEFPGSGPLTADEAAQIIAAPVQPQEVP
ncbi:hypothetical protein LJR074_002604 [Acidovorax sp. LjRoot74]|uniref:hypothetical protein n=1 Tax=Acidovorax sp. LjRoot74 TaxID=3342337 RepID=UPI003ECF01AD